MIMKFSSLDINNIEEVYNLFKRNKIESLIPFQYFKKGTLEDKDFDPKLSLILRDNEKSTIIAAFIAIIRVHAAKKICYLKACLVDKNFQRQGIGTRVLKELINRAQSEKCYEISYGNSVPNYWQPGVDLRHTSLYFFLKKHRFHRSKLRQNLTVNLEDLIINPNLERGEFHFERVKNDQFENLVNFVQDFLPERTWAQEVELSFECDPPTTFIAKDKENKIIGWATHSQLFPGSFGPTGVLEKLRGKGIGGELLKWCLWDMKQNYLKQATIMWVVGDTIKYYSKVIDAYIFPVFIPMTYRLS
jgi:GNAT superfamily N-acetyltransferase